MKERKFETWPMKMRLVGLTSKKCQLNAFLAAFSLLQVHCILTGNSPGHALSILVFLYSYFRI